MTKAEATYWKDYIDRAIIAAVGALTDTEGTAAGIHSFAESHMATITGQQMLPQTMFREFLRKFADIPAQQDILNERIAWIEENLPFDECSEAEIYAMFAEGEDGLLHLNALTETDEDDYILSENITVDEDGYITIPETVTIDVDEYLIEN